MKKEILHIGDASELTEERKEKIKSLITMAGGARYIAKECNVNYDTYHNVLRDMSTDFDTVNKMISKARKIFNEKLKAVA